MNYEILLDKLLQNQEWQYAFELKTDIDIERFLASCQFASENGASANILDLERLRLFAYYSCQSEKKLHILISEHIKQTVIDQGLGIGSEMINKKIAEQTLSLIFELASTVMLRSLV